MGGMGKGMGTEWNGMGKVVGRCCGTVVGTVVGRLWEGYHKFVDIICKTEYNGAVN